MVKARNSFLFFLTLSVLAAAIALTSHDLLSKIRFGLEFRGGYEIYYTVSPKSPNSEVSQKDLRATADILRQRVDKIGMSEPEIHLEGTKHIRMKMAGLTSSEESRSSLRSPDGLPTILTEKYSQTVGSVLGATALKDTLKAGIIGICFIFLLLIVLYRGVGLLAAISTIVYLWLLVVLFTTLQATLSLSAVVAFVLGIGITADASIICFERIREELAHGTDLPQAVRKGFAGSFATIRDANLVTALAMIALFIAGIGPIQGFSVTMFASIIISVTTNFFLVRFLVTLLADTRILPLWLFIGGRKNKTRESRLFNFVRTGRATIFMSLAIITLGAIFYHVHKLNLDIDFTAGTALDIDLNRSITLETATKIMTDGGRAPATVAIGGVNNTHIAARFDEVLNSEELRPIISQFKASYESVEYEENTADPGVARDFAHRAIWGIIFACISIALYVGFVFSWRVSISTLVLILHDIFIVLALFAIFRCEIDVTFIAALLTIIGYSLYNKVVIFSRIRENSPNHSLKFAANKYSTVNFGVLVNLSVKQTLNRSIYTVLTVVMASLSLFLFACEPLQMFSLALIFGLISGAFSSVFFAGPLWLSLSNRIGSKRKFLYGYYLAGSTLACAVIIAGFYMWPSNTKTTVKPAFVQSSSAVVQQVSSANHKVITDPLGDLTLFRVIAENSLTMVETGKFQNAKKRIKDLEKSWDDAEQSLRPINPPTWLAVDKSVDRVLTQLRSGKPDSAACSVALNSFIAKCHSLDK